MNFLNFQETIFLGWFYEEAKTLTEEKRTLTESILSKQQRLSKLRKNLKKQEKKLIEEISCSYQTVFVFIYI